MIRNSRVRRIFNSRDENITDLTSSLYELEPFDSIVHALRWKQIKARIPLCMKKTLRNRFMLPNIIYVGYTITLLSIDFNANLNALLSNNTLVKNVKTTSNISTILRTSILDQPIQNNPYMNRLYIGLAIVSLIMGFLYCWAWRDRSVFDIIMIPEYLSLIQSGLYLWSASWYSKQDTLGGYYTIAVHKIELTASVVGLFAAIGWVLSWFMTYTRIFGRGYTLDDPDMISNLAMVANAIIYLVYNIQLIVSPEYYETNMLYKYGDICDFVEACFCVFACLRDDDWFWFFPLAGQYGIALGRVQVEAKTLPQFGKNPILITNMCRRRTKIKRSERHDKINMRNDVITVPIFAPSLEHP
ncbi:unnamed protein product [Adineta steineri]|uniref:Uncharacterized protein n=1 Tax=Adineta steineri TaxID=433720 RepID=A0A814F6Z7_9BILA|nr:unnamed protein product [Adineta steineri]CAF1012367.1 unnamed protein product [Adineta steineri]CAF1050960.1 unnamed protein product [Adineta steineri]